jgi:hypothetical protein
MKEIHHLIAFPEAWIKSYEVYRQCEKDRDTVARDKWREDKELYRAWQQGGRHRGSFLDKDKLIEIVKKSSDPYGICEGYYEYLLIETHYLDCIDGCKWDSAYDHEMWFKYTKIDEDNWEYQQIDRPECLMGTVNFL